MIPMCISGSGLLICLILLMGGYAKAADMFDPETSLNAAISAHCFITAADGTDRVYAPWVGNGDGDHSLLSTNAVEIDWDEPREIGLVVIKGSAVPGQKDIILQWWHSKWPENGSGGWMELDDPFKGNWVSAACEYSRRENAAVLKLLPLSKEELDVKTLGAPFRKTHKIRVMFKTPSMIGRVEAYTSVVLKKAELRVEWAADGSRKAQQGKHAYLSIINGILPGGPKQEIKEGRAQFAVEYGSSEDRLNASRGRITIQREKQQPFTVFVDDVIRDGSVFIPDLGVLVSDASREIAIKNWAPPANSWPRTVTQMVESLPEQTFQRALREIPRLQPREAYIGVPNMRQEAAVIWNGDIEFSQRSLRTDGEDRDRSRWGADLLRFSFASGKEPQFGFGRQVSRHLENGYLPVIVSEWKTGDISYKSESLATLLRGKIEQAEDALKGDEPIVVLNQTEIVNSGSLEQTAYLWLRPSVPSPITLSSDGIIRLDEPSDKKPVAGYTPVRGKIEHSGKGAFELITGRAFKDDEGKEDLISPVIRYTVDLAPGESVKVFFTAPFVEMLSQADLSALSSLRYDRSRDDVLAYWIKRIDSGMTYNVPDDVLNNFWRSNLWRVLISTDRDPKTGLYQHGAATVRYANYANETCMVAESLDMRGEHREARKLLEPFLVSQSARGLPGKFKSKEGLLHSAHPDPDDDHYTALGYNMNHGWVMWTLGRHFQYTGDAEYLSSIAGKLVKAADWITSERKATKIKAPDGSVPVEYGLAPAGQLEDVNEYLYFYATNAYYYAGIKAVADALSSIKHPEAARILKDAEEYRKDIHRSIRRAAETTAVVRLRNGKYIPYVPHRCYALTNISEGWIREGLYCSLHLLDANVIKPDEDLTTWILENLEDNVFLDPVVGYGIEDPEKVFDFGGFTKQPNLLTNPTAYLRRDQIKMFLRALFNMGSASLHDDMVCFAEWIRKPGSWGGPLYKTPDECKFIQYLRQMLVMEEDGKLLLGMGVPLDWMAEGKTIEIKRASTFAGMLDMTIKSEAASNKVSADIRLTARKNPAKITLRLRHPSGKPIRSVTVNGKAVKEFDASTHLIELSGKDGSFAVVALY